MGHLHRHPSPPYPVHALRVALLHSALLVPREGAGQQSHMLDVQVSLHRAQQCRHTHGPHDGSVVLRHHHVGRARALEAAAHRVREAVPLLQAHQLRPLQPRPLGLGKSVQAVKIGVVALRVLRVHSAFFPCVLVPHLVAVGNNDFGYISRNSTG
eukprot:CAMPEP_0114284846 /NCGR_PEP_ID=MMETSP0059-20121206/4866_2 /TAXON_ID=36894 /ORGANISM="Pyramimonas parkeae, Strain CCMP726" /LENGTH=154 /DNA_ID=CAMNT_0001405695 /DNA_START=631 /DNA_END=1095 /DNA_ORIENTATION=-